MKDDLIFHMVPKRNWEQWQQGGIYHPPSIDEEGFIPCSSGNQINATANRIFKGERRLMLLVIDTSTVEAAIKYEMAGNSDREEKYPHIYGALNLDAVIDKIRLYPNKEGIFELEFDSD